MKFLIKDNVAYRLETIKSVSLSKDDTYILIEITLGNHSINIGNKIEGFEQIQIDDVIKVLNTVLENTCTSITLDEFSDTLFELLKRI